MNKDTVIGTPHYRRELEKIAFMFMLDPDNQITSTMSMSQSMWLGRSYIFLHGILENELIPKSLELADLINFLIYHENQNLRDYVESLPGMNADVMNNTKTPDDDTLRQHGYITMPFNSYKDSNKNFIKNINVQKLDGYKFLITKNNLNFQLEFDNSSILSHWKVNDVSYNDVNDTFVINSKQITLYDYIIMYEKLSPTHKQYTNQMIAMISI